MSLASWMVILVKALDLRRFMGQARRIESFWHAADFADGLSKLGDRRVQPLPRAGAGGPRGGGAPQRAAAAARLAGASEWLTRSLRNSIDESTARMQSGLAVLASVGSTAPFIGLFGTVWGIYHALLAISAAGQATIDKVAGPIGEALIMTALGLAVAIPAVLGYNALVRGNKGVLNKLNRFAHDLHAYFVTGARVASGSPTKVVPMKKGELTMAFGTQDDTDEVMNEINMTPLVDVMLVLLIIFIITVPVMKHSVNIDLPRASSPPQDTKPRDRAPVGRRAGRATSGTSRRSDEATCRAGCAAAAARTPQPELHLRGDKDARYERVAQALAAAQQPGCARSASSPSRRRHEEPATATTPAAAAGASRPRRRRRAARRWTATQLLRGSRLVEIRHNGELYRLQATRLGKLILTK